MSVQKTDIKQLYFDRNRFYYIEFDLEKINTCDQIYEALKNDIENKIKKLYKNVQGINFKFIMIYSKLSSKYDTNSLTEIKIDRSFILTELLQSNQYTLYYLPVSNYDNKRNIRKDKINGQNEIKNLKNKEIEKYLISEGIYYFDKALAQFIYGKGFIDEQKFIVNTKNSKIEIAIDQIKKEEYSENQVPLALQVFKTKCPNYIIQILQYNTTYIFGLYKQKSYLIWKNAISSAKIKNKNRAVDTQFNNDLNKTTYLIYLNCNSIPDKCRVINQILENPEKRKIFFEVFDDNKIADITTNIFNYKINIKNSEYIGALACLKQINFYLDFNNNDNEKEKEKEIEKYKDIFSDKLIYHFKSILANVNDLFSKTVNGGGNINNNLKDILTLDMFDKLYIKIYDLYIVPFFQNFKETLKKEYNFNEKPEVIKKLHLLLSKYTINFFDLNDSNKFYNLFNDNDEKNKNENINNNINDSNGDNIKNNKKNS